MGAERDFSICCPQPFPMPTIPFDPSFESNRPGYLQRTPGADPSTRGPSTRGPSTRGSSTRGTAKAPLRPSRPAQTPRSAPVAARPAAAPQRGDWLFACRPGAEDDVLDELRALRLSPSSPQPGLVLAGGTTEKGKRVAPTALQGLVFARQGLPVHALFDTLAEDAQVAAKQLADGICRDLKPRPLAVHVFAADSERGKTLSGRCAALHAALANELSATGYSVSANGPAAHSEGGQLVMVCLLSVEQAVAGVLLTSVALSLHPGGIQRVRRSQEAPSRSASKLSEALAWLGHGPQGGESCVDLGAAPGGWSQVLAERGCAVVAVDTGGLAPGLSRRIQHVRRNAFDYEPEEPADWLCCDMAYRPLEVAGLLARWGRRRWARFLIANIKLPMRQRVAMLGRVREILESGGWTGLRARQLYHDRDEITLFAWRGFGLDTRVQHQSPRRNDEPTVAFRAPVRTPAARTPRAGKGAASRGRGSSKPTAERSGAPKRGSARPSRPASATRGGGDSRRGSGSGKPAGKPGRPGGGAPRRSRPSR